MFTRILSTAALCAAASLPIMAAELISNGDFESVDGNGDRITPTSYGFNSIAKVSDAGKWLANPNGARSFNDDDTVLAYPDSSNGVARSQDGDTSEASLLQVIQDGKASTGDATFSADVYQLTSALSLTDVSVQILGYNGDATTVDAALTTDDIRTPKNSQTESGIGAVLLSTTLTDQGGNLNAWNTQDWTVPLGTGYDYLVVSIASPGHSLSTGGDLFYLDNISLSTGGSVTPSIPNVSALAVSHEEIQLTWDTVTPTGTEPGYEIWRDDNADGTFEHVGNISEDGSTSYSFNDSGLTANTTYEYRVDAVDDMATLP